MDNSTLSLYHTFSVVARTGSLSAASGELFISQPAISKSIKRLESTLNTVLFYRKSRGVELTAEGLALYEYVKKAFDTLNAGEISLKHINDLGIGHLTIGVSSTLCKHMLLPYLETFVKIHPHIQIAIQCQSSLPTVQLLENGQIDFGLIAQPANNSHLSYIPLGQLQDIFVATPQYINNLIEREKIEFIDVLSHSNLILLDKQNMTRRYVEQYLNKWNIDTANALEINSMELLIDFTKTGLGVGCSIGQFIERELASGELIALKVPEPMAKRKICFAYSNNAPTTAAVEAFIKHIT